MMTSVGQNSFKNALFQYFIFTVYGTNKVELMHLILITDTELRGHYICSTQVELKESG